MATVSVQIPDELVKDLIAALREIVLGSATMTPHQVYVAWLKGHIEPLLQAYKLRTVNAQVQAEVVAREAVEAQLRVEAEARRVAAAQIVALVKTAVGNIT